MPHVIVKMMSGRSEAQKNDLANKLARVVMETLGSESQSISVAIEDVPAGRWEADVFEPEIKGKKQTLYKKPGYASVD
jgi:4-oxalocrotonate tautomerase